MTFHLILLGTIIETYKMSRKGGRDMDNGKEKYYFFIRSRRKNPLG
jgi:hypothetical protein